MLRRSITVALLWTIGALPACVPLANSMNSGAEENRRVNVLIEGALIGPVDRNGHAWDGPGLSTEQVDVFAGLAVEVFGAGTIPAPLQELTGAFAGKLANSIFASFEGPDPKGKVIAYAEGKEQSFALPTVQDSYTPTWGLTISQFPVHGTLKVSLRDADFIDDDPIGTVIINSEDLLAAEEARSTLGVDTSESTRGLIQRVFISVSEP